MFDATNTTRERREMILNFAIDNSYKVSYKILVIMGLTLYIYRVQVQTIVRLTLFPVYSSDC